MQEEIERERKENMHWLKTIPKVFDLKQEISFKEKQIAQLKYQLQDAQFARERDSFFAKEKLKAKDKCIEGLRAATERMLQNRHLDATSAQFWTSIWESNYERASQVISTPAASSQSQNVQTREAFRTRETIKSQIPNTQAQSIAQLYAKPNVQISKTIASQVPPPSSEPAARKE